MTDPNAVLMAAIRARWGAQIAAACAGTAVPEAFLAGLVANETGGDASKTRFEALDFGQMCQVMIGKRAHFEALGAVDLVPPFLTLNEGLRLLGNYATSWGLTQIMGYQVLPFHKPLSILTDPGEHLKFAVVLLIQFANRWDLELAHADSGPASAAVVQDSLKKLFACWNCGQPFPEKTFDPAYCSNGLLRASLYAGNAVTGD